jgi:hypothetical protein
MGKKDHQLAMRDPALAALVGISGMSDFGAEPVMGSGESEFGGINFGGDDFGVGFGDDYGDDYGDEPDVNGEGEMGAERRGRRPHHPLYHPNPRAQAILMAHMRRNKHRAHRALLLEPNMHSDLKIERYTFSINDTITALQTPQGLDATGSPDVNFRPERVTMNTVSPGMIFVTDGRVANVSFTVGGLNDAWQFNANGVGQSLSVPTLTPANRATVTANYTGLVPSPLSGTGSFQFCVSFSGPATLSA